MIDPLSNEDYLFQIYAQVIGSRKWAGRTRDEVEGIVDSQIAAGIVPADGRQKWIEQMLERENPAKLLNGAVTARMKELVLDFLGAPGQYDDVLVGILPSRNFNAFVMPAPFDGHIVCMNYFLIVVQEWVTSFFLEDRYPVVWVDSSDLLANYPELNALKDADSDEHLEELINSMSDLMSRLCFEQYLIPALQLRAAILHLANAASDPGSSDWMNAVAEAAAIKKHHDKRDEIHICTCIDTFVLAHEFGHVSLNHCDPGKLKQREFAANLVGTYELNHRQEFEADAFAASAALTAVERGGWKGIFTGAALLYRFLHLMEIISNREPSATHPPALERWLRIKLQWQDNDYAIECCAVVDKVFDELDRAAMPQKR